MGFLEKNKIEIILGLTVLFGFIFRLINVYTKVLLGDPPHLALHAVNFLDSGLLIVWDQSAFLWYAFTDIFYGIFGITQFASRFSSLLFGTLSIIAIYLFTLEFSKNKRIALISAVIFSFAPAFIWHAADEHDISVLFFIIISFYSLIYGLNNNSKAYIYISAALFGVSCMWKAYVPILIIPYLGMFFHYHRQKKYDLRKNYKTILYVLLIMFILITPNLVYNYYNYKHNGVVDFLYATHFTFLKNEKIQELYGWTLGGEINSDRGFLYKLLIDGNPSSESNNDSNLKVGFTQSIYSNGPLLSFACLIGITYLFYRRKDPFSKNYLFFYALYFIIPFVFLVNGNTLNKHYVHFLAFALPAIAYTIDDVFSRIKSKVEKVNLVSSKNYFAYLVFFIVLIFTFFVTLSLTSSLTGSFFSKNPEGILIDYKSENIPQNSLIIYDDRIYNSEAGWLFNDRFYIPVSFTSQLLSYSQQSNYSRPTETYIIECVLDDCGWGTISKNQELNSSMESFFESVNNQSIPLVKSINSKVSGETYQNPIFGLKSEESETFKIYKTTLLVDMNMAREVKKQYNYFLYPSGYENKELPIFKNFIYQPSGLIGDSINKIAWLAFYLNIIISILSILYLFYELYLVS